MTIEQPTARDVGSVPARPPLPLGLWIIAVLLVLGGVVLLLGMTGLSPGLLSGGLLGLEREPEGRIGVGIVGAAMIVAGIGMLMRIRSAWGLAMLIVLLGLAVNLISYFRGDPNLLRLAIYVATAFYLNQRQVREVFLGRSADGSG